MSMLTRETVHNYCRTCLQFIKREVAKCISDELREMMLVLCNPNTVDDKNFPKLFCKLCYDKLHSFAEFRKLCLNSTNLLMGILRAEPTNTVSVVETHVKKELNRSISEEQDEDDDALLLPELAPLMQVDANSTQLKHDSSSNTAPSMPFIKSEINADGYFDDDMEMMANQHELDSDYEDFDPMTYEQKALNFKQEATTSSAALDANRSEMQHKIKRDNSKKSIPCPHCPKRAYKKVYIDAHIRKVHEGQEKPFQCSHCEKAYTSYKHLLQHLATQHDVGVVSPIKEDFFGFLNGFSVEEEIICEFCMKHFSSKRTLSEHRKRHLQIKDHICKVCGVAKVTKTELMTHMRTHNANLEKFQCYLCPQMFNHKNAISRHVRVVHEGLKKFSCSFCPKRFGTRNSQEAHERLHTGEKPFHCNICPRSYAQVEGLRNHMQNHDKSLRKHVCSYCNQRFLTKKNRIDHEQRHMGDRPHICLHCSRGFHIANDLVTHLRTTHDDEQEYDGRMVNNAIINAANIVKSEVDAEDDDYEYDDEEYEGEEDEDDEYYENDMPPEVDEIVPASADNSVALQNDQVLRTQVEVEEIF